MENNRAQVSDKSYKGEPEDLHNLNKSTAVMTDGAFLNVGQSPSLVSGIEALQNPEISSKASSSLRNNIIR